jgi:nucleoid-associated protein YejK
MIRWDDDDDDDDDDDEDNDDDEDVRFIMYQYYYFDIFVIVLAHWYSSPRVDMSLHWNSTQFLDCKRTPLCFYSLMLHA